MAFVVLWPEGDDIPQKKISASHLISGGNKERIKKGKKIWRQIARTDSRAATYYHLN